MEDVKVLENEKRYEYENLNQDVSESFPLDFYSPYGCSKGTADQYVRDYARIYGLRTVVFRKSCIYGQHQFGNEDQGWVAHFLINSLLGKSLTIFGNGKQVRDVLFIDDLVSCYQKAIANIDKAAGHVYNIGGGPQNTTSLLELINRLETMMGKDIEYSFSDWRPGDQPIYISDIRKAENDFGWTPKVSLTEGLEKLYDWVVQNRSQFGH